LSFRFGDLIVRVDAVYVHFFMQKWGEERIFPHPNIYYRTKIKAPVSVSFPMEGGCVFLWNFCGAKRLKAWKNRQFMV
ncbi:hypothetical protein, partial [Acidaminococcus intestini]